MTDKKEEEQLDVLIKSIDKNDTDKGNAFVMADTFSGEMKAFIKLFVPICIANLMEFLPQYAAFVFVGHLPNNKELLAAVGLSRAFTNICAVAPSWGFSLALGTLIPQTIGANQPQNIAIYYQQALIICFSIAIPISVLQYYAGEIMAGLDQDPAIIPYVSTYCRTLIPYIWGMILLSVLQRVIRPLKFNWELLYILSFTGLLSIPLNYLLVFYFEYGYLGTAITMDICLFLASFCSIIMLVRKNYGFIFKPLPLSLTCDWISMKHYLALGLPGLMQSSIGWFVSEMVTLLSGYVANASLGLAATSSVLVLNSIGIVLNVACGIPLGIRFGKYIGAASLNGARRSVKVGFVLSSIILLLQVIVLLVFRRALPKLLIDNQQVIDLASNVIYFLIFRTIAFSVYIMLSNIYRGLGKPYIPAIVAPICHFVGGLLIDMILLFYFDLRRYSDIGIFIIWGCVSFSYFLTAVIITSLQICGCVSWQSAVIEAQQRIKHAKTRNAKNYGSINQVNKK